MTGLNLLFPKATGQSPARLPSSAQAPQQPAPVVAAASPVLPPAPERMSLNHWRGKEPVIAGDRIAIETGNAGSGPQLVLDLKVPGAYPGDRDHIEFYKAVAGCIWLACPDTEIRSQAGRMVVAGTPETREEIDRAVQQMRTLCSFIQAIGGNVGHVCRTVADQPQMVDYLDSVLGGSSPRFFSPVPPNPGKGAALLDPETVMLLGERFAAANRPDLQLALYDVALPNCIDSPARNDLCRQWIGLNNRANLEHIEDATGLQQQASVLSRLLVFCADGLADDVLAALAIQRDLVLDRLADARPLSVPLVTLLLGQKCGWRFDGKEGDLLAVKAFEALIRHHREQGNGAKAAEALANLKSMSGSSAREAVERLTARLAEPRDARGRTPPMLACPAGELFETRLTLTNSHPASLFPSATLKTGREVQPKQATPRKRASVLLEKKPSPKHPKPLPLVEKRKWGRTSLMRACEEGKLETVRDWIASGADLDAQENNRNTPLIVACREGQIEVVELLLDGGAEVETADKDGRTPLMHACADPNVEIAKLLLGRGAKVESADKGRKTPLMRACRNGHVATAKLLLDHGANIEAKDTSGMAPLVWACFQGFVGATKLLLDRGANIETKDRRGWTSLIWSCQLGHLNVVTLLLDRGAKIDSRDEHGMTSLMWACHEGKSEVVRLLLDRGARRDARNNQGQVALDIAKKKGLSLIIDMLTAGGTVDPATKIKPAVVALPRGVKEAGPSKIVRRLEVSPTPTIAPPGLPRPSADEKPPRPKKQATLKTPPSVEKRNREMLMRACQEGDLVVVQRLAASEDLEATDIHGYTPLTLACMNGDVEVAKLLLDHGAGLDTQDKRGWTPLMRLLAWGKDQVKWRRDLVEWGRGHFEVVKLLLDRGAKFENAQGRRLFMWMCENGDVEMVKLLLDRWADRDLEAQDEHGRTPLLRACEMGHVAVVELLLLHEAKVDCMDMSYQTPLMLACKNGHIAVVQLLLTRGADLATKDEFSATPLMLACENGQAEMMKFLLDLGAYIERKGKHRYDTLLMRASEKGHVAVVNVLLDHGAAIDVKGRAGWTPLMWACWWGHYAVVKRLLDDGVRRDVKNSDKRTALDIARKQQNVAIVELLQSRKGKQSVVDRLFG